jgi:transposase
MRSAIHPADSGLHHPRPVTQKLDQSSTLIDLGAALLQLPRLAAESTSSKKSDVRTESRRKMATRSPYRRHTQPFKFQLCKEIRAGALSRRDAQKKYDLSANLIQRWLTLFDQKLLTEDAAPAIIDLDSEAKIAALERKVGQLTMELDRLKGNCAAAPPKGPYDA